MKKTAAIGGASGLVGNHCLQQLCNHSNYDEVRVLTRRRLGLTHPKISEFVIDFNALTSHADILEGVTDMFCCLGTTIKKAGTQKAFRKVDYDYVTGLGRLSQGKCQRFMVVSAVGVNPNSGIFYNRVKGEMEETLSAIDIPAVHIFKPGILTGKRNEFRLGEKVGIGFMSLLGPLLFGPLTKYKSIKGADVAHAMVLAAQLENTGVYRYEYGNMMDLIGATNKPTG